MSLLSNGARRALLLASAAMLASLPALAAEPTLSVSGAARAEAASAPKAAALPSAAEAAAALAQEEESDRVDPWEGANRSVHSFNDGLDEAVLEPVARGYRDVVPEFGRNRVSNFMANLKAPQIFVNSTLAGDADSSVTTVMRFMVNTTFGIGGLFDVATEMGMPKTKADFGKTLATWGVGPGPYTVLPVFGPSTVRDTGGKIVDMALDPVSYFLAPPLWASLTTSAADGISQREQNLDTVAELKRSSLDYYAAMRSAWMQHREKEVTEKLQFPKPKDASN